MIRFLARHTLCALALAALAACGQSVPAASGPPTPTSAGREPSAPAATATPAAPAAASTVAVTTPAAPEASPVASGPFAGIEQGTTPEGYRALGSASAAVTLVMYSDFL
jgi:hypothetical protein